mgnify:CR=1 FL=1
MIDAIVAEVLELQEQENTTLPLLEKQMKEVENSIENMLNAIQAGVLTSSTKHVWKSWKNSRKNWKSALPRRKSQSPG